MTIEAIERRTSPSVWARCAPRSCCSASFRAFRRASSRIPPGRSAAFAADSLESERFWFHELTVRSTVRFTIRLITHATTRITMTVKRLVRGPARLARLSLPVRSNMERHTKSGAAPQAVVRVCASMIRRYRANLEIRWISAINSAFWAVVCSSSAAALSVLVWRCNRSADCEPTSGTPNG